MTLNDVRQKISDYILDNEHKLIDMLDNALKELMIKSLSDKDEQNTLFFNTDSDQMNKLTDIAFQNFMAQCDEYPDLKKDSNGHYENAKKDLATSLSSHIPTILNTSKNELTPFITIQSRGMSLNKELTEIIIRGANFNNRKIKHLYTHPSKHNAQHSKSHRKTRIKHHRTRPPNHKNRH